MYQLNSIFQISYYSDFANVEVEKCTICSPCSVSGLSFDMGVYSIAFRVHTFFDRTSSLRFTAIAGLSSLAPPVKRRRSIVRSHTSSLTFIQYTTCSRWLDLIGGCRLDGVCCSNDLVSVPVSKMKSEKDTTR